MIRRALVFAGALLSASCAAQLPSGRAEVLQKLQPGNVVPEKLLATRSVVIHDASFTDAELLKVQEAFKETGIDAVGYFASDVVFAGKDIVRTHVNYFISREIGYLVFLMKEPDHYSAMITAFNNESSMVNPAQPAWEVTEPNLIALLGTIYRTALNSQQTKNYLINDFAERGFDLAFITGRRSPFFAIDLKADRLAVPWFQDAAADSALVQLMRELYPFEYGFVTPSDDESAYREQGYQYLLCYVHTRGEAAQTILGYDMNEAQTAITSVTYPNGELKLKTISASTPVYKFYMKHIISGNVFLGTKWDADYPWENALRNHLKALRAEFKIN